MADQTTGSIHIDAAPEAVMAVIADLPSYPSWSEGITSVDVLSVFEDDDRPADARFSISSGPISDTYELEYDWDGDTRVSWSLTSGDMLSQMEGSYDLEPERGGTTVTYRLTVDLKVKIPMMGMVKRQAEKKIIDTALQGLKKEVERRAASR